MAILGWQHLTTPTKFADVVYAQLAQAAAIKAMHPDLPVYVYCSFGWVSNLHRATTFVPCPNSPTPLILRIISMMMAAESSPSIRALSCPTKLGSVFGKMLLSLLSPLKIAI